MAIRDFRVVQNRKFHDIRIVIGNGIVGIERIKCQRIFFEIERGDELLDESVSNRSIERGIVFP